MTKSIAIFAMGEMGAGIAQRLVSHGARVISHLGGRSQASIDRARKAGVELVDSDAAMLSQADLFLSVLPPAEAPALARRILAAIQATGAAVTYVDCNAIAPTTVGAIAAPFAAAQIRFVDAAIIGPPPKPDGKSPRFYASGPDLTGFAALQDFGLDIRPLGAAPGEASALKMSYAGITKGFQALGTAMVLGAQQAGVTDAFWAELQASQPVLLDWLTRELPRMVPKAYRWIGEMDEISIFLQSEPGAAAMLAGAARLYQAVATDNEAGKDALRIKALDAFVSRGGSGR